MSTLKFPPPPPGIGRCAECSFYCATLETEGVVTQGGVIPVKAALAAGVAMLNASKVTMAPCARYPEWKNVDSSQWCGEFRDLHFHDGSRKVIPIKG